ncbi:MAG: hypothetical protein R3175_05385 [Marinobacter sp.]|uniref:hypothetical protein n=1 Tax=Marinobacter sp. TaxID=50741 RepID=UPI00299D21CD|nr:hypothetical protein [Marinobacter sp.]MDX1755477.1 hypothetical protein [Marinobacter sp.]
MLCWTASTTAGGEAGQVRLITSLEESSEASVHAGQQLITAVYENCGLQVNFLEAPPARSLSLAEEGRADGELARLRTSIDANGPLVALEPPITVLQVVPIYVNPDIPASNTLASVKRVGYINGYRMVPPLLPRGVSTLLAHNTEHLVLLLERDRIDVGLTLGLDAEKALLEHEGLMAGNPVLQEPVYHFIHRSRIDDMPCLSKSLQRLKEEGHVDRVLDSIVSEQLSSPP